MAQMVVYTPDALMQQLYKLSNIDDIAPKVLRAGIKPLKKELQDNLKKHKQTGELLDSLTEKTPRNYQGVWRQMLTFEGESKKKKYNRKGHNVKKYGGDYVRQEAYRNYQKALALEYGTAKQPATPIIRPAIVSSEKACVDQMQATFNREAGK